MIELPPDERAGQKCQCGLEELESLVESVSRGLFLPFWHVDIFLPTVQGGPSGRRHHFADIKLRVAF